MYFQHLSTALDQCCNALCGGWPDETLSSRAYRWYVAGIRAWPKKCLDTLFFWHIEHCRLAYTQERCQRHVPPELRL